MTIISRSVLIFRIGQLGDTIVALPAIWAVRKHFPEARLTLLSDQHPGKPYVRAADIFEGTDMFCGFEAYPVPQSVPGRLLGPFHFAVLLARLRAQRFDTLVYLAPSSRSRRQVKRDRGFFAAAGIKQFIGMEGFSPPPRRPPGRTLPVLIHEADSLLARLAVSGIPVPPAGDGSMNLCLDDREEIQVQAWLKRLPDDGQRRWIGFGAGSKMPAKKWSIDRFGEVGDRLIASHDVWPVIFGGAEDRAVGAGLLRRWGRGFNAAGELRLRAAAAALRRCHLYVGNDTGTMHLAAAAGTACVGVFSGRDWPGKWYPYGTEHQVLRASIDCEGCGLTECLDRRNECLNQISVSAAVAACHTALEKQSRARGEHDSILSRAS